MRTLLFALLLSACTDPDPGECLVPLEACGDAPSYPGAVASFEGDAVTMSRATYDGLAKWHTDVTAWRDCVSDL